MLNYLKNLFLPQATFSDNDLSRLQSHSMILVTVAFNNPELIKAQIKALNSKLTDDYLLVVCDNSSLPKAREQIKVDCQELNTIYQTSHKVTAKFANSASHGKALDWIFGQILPVSDCKWIGSLDHDIFPRTKTSLEKKIQKALCYGLRQERGDKWYLWPGFQLFRAKVLKNSKFSFMPASGLDTGGANWNWIYSKLPKHKVIFANQSYRQLVQKSGKASLLPLTKQEQKEQLVESDNLVEVLDDWNHFFNGSDWKQTGNKITSITNIVNHL